MSHSLTRIWLHIVWGTKDRYPYMTCDTRHKIIEHLEQKFAALKSKFELLMERKITFILLYYSIRIGL